MTNILGGLVAQGIHVGFTNERSRVRLPVRHRCVDYANCSYPRFSHYANKAIEVDTGVKREGNGRLWKRCRILTIAPGLD